MDEANKTVLALVLRHGLTTLGGMLVSSGYINSSEASGLVGSGMVLAGVGWSWWQKKGQAALREELARWRASANVPASAPPEGGSK